MATVQDYLKNDKWVKRIDGLFTTFDVNKNGYVSAEDWMITVDNLQNNAPDRPEAIAKLREAMLEFTTSLGLTEGVQADKKKFRELEAVFCLSEAEKMKKGEMTSLDKFNNAMFDFVDKNHDGSLTFEEYKILVGATNFGEEAAKATFNLLDKNKNGKVERKEYLASSVKFWCTLEDPDTKGFFGDKYE